MEKTRVSYGEKFWFIRTDGKVNYGLEYEDLWCNDFFNCGNYFHTKEEAEVVAEKFHKVLEGAWVLTSPEGETFSRKVEAVLNGADVIEMPSEEDIRAYSICNHLSDKECQSIYEVVTWLKTDKIVK